MENHSIPVDSKPPSPRRENESTLAPPASAQLSSQNLHQLQLSSPAKTSSQSSIDVLSLLSPAQIGIAWNHEQNGIGSSH